MSRQKFLDVTRGFGGRDIGCGVADFKVEIDIEKILSILGRRALKNKNGRGTALRGAVMVIVSNVKRGDVK